MWNNHLKKTAAWGVGSGIPDFLERYLKEINSAPKTNWKQLLHDFIQFDTSDYDFLKPDRRYSQDIILPSFCDEIDGAKVENLWFLIDTSGSVTDEAMTIAFNEIKNAIDQIGHLSGILSFFDAAVSEPEEFETIEKLEKMHPIGGGGTSFYAIFEKLSELKEKDSLPSAIIIMTDGFAPFPEEEAALGVPVIWLMVDSEKEAPWGLSVFINS